MKYYKLTDSNNETQNGTTWGDGITYKALGKGTALCSSDVIHVYDHPLKAVLFNLIHANFTKPKLWECRVRKVVANDGLKVGVKECTTLREIPLPKITTSQKVRFAIYCALEVYLEESFVNWAKKWLSGEDRTAEAARTAAEAARAAEWAARSAAEWVAEAAEAAGRTARSAEAAEWAAEAAKWAARSAEAAEWAAEAARAAGRTAAEVGRAARAARAAGRTAAEAGRTAAEAARTAAEAARAAEWAARPAARTPLNFVTLAKKAIEEETDAL